MGDHTPDFLSDNVTDNWINSTIISSNEEEDKFKIAEKHVAAKKSYLPIFTEGESESMFSESERYRKSSTVMKDDCVGDKVEEQEEEVDSDLDDQLLDPDEQVSVTKKSDDALQSDTDLTTGNVIISSDEIVASNRCLHTEHSPSISPDAAFKAPRYPRNTSPGGKYFAQVYKSGCCSTTRRVVYVEAITGRLVLPDGEEVERQGKLISLSQKEEQALYK